MTVFDYPEEFYLTHGNVTGVVISGLFNHVTELEPLATSTGNSNGVYFVPAFSGLQVRLNNLLTSGCITCRRGTIYGIIRLEVLLIVWKLAKFGYVYYWR